nr:immunoglobulin heavy chain junction region [Mus musculus]
CASTGFFFDSW